MDDVNMVIKPPESLLHHVESFQQPRSQVSSCCDECLISSSEQMLKRCSQCREVEYCSKKCQSRAWKEGHKISCGKICIRPVPGKGLGVIASRNIKQGEIVATEMPLLKFKFGKGLTESLMKLTTPAKKKLMSLYDREAVCGGDKKTVLGVVVTNCLAGADGETLVYHLISRFNHSCVPNGRVDDCFPTKFIAIKDINVGEELSWCYDIASCMQQVRSQRQLELEQGWGIPTCRCTCCNLEGQQQVTSDVVRDKIKRVEQKLIAKINKRRILDTIPDKSETVSELIIEKRGMLYLEGLDTSDTLARLCKDMLHDNNLSTVDMHKLREGGISHATLIKDEQQMKYFEEFDVDVGCTGCYRCTSDYL